MPGRTIAIGDIHGCLAPLKAILGAIDPGPDDTIVALGDYVDRGPDSRGVIDELIALKDRCQVVALMGNHEEMMLEVVRGESEPYGWLRHGGVDTLDSYGFTGNFDVIGQSHRDFYDSLVDHYASPTHLFFHANYEPMLPPEEQPVELLRWVKLTEFLPAAHQSGLRTIVGHTHNRQGLVMAAPHLVCIDTYCYGGGVLTALDVDADVVWQAEKDGRLISAEPRPLRRIALAL